MARQRHLLSTALCEAGDNLPEGEQRLVYVYGFLGSQARRPCLAGALTTRQVYKLKFANDDVVDGGVVDDLYCQGENRVRARGCVVQVMRCNHFVLYTLVVQFYGMLGVVAAEHEQVLHRELLLLAPSDSEACLV